MAKDKDKVNLHVAQWRHNRELIPQIPSSHPDWIVTITFYVTVQAIDAALANEGITVKNHDERFEAIANVNRLSAVRNLYHPLYDLCRKLRYLANPNLWIPPAEIDKRIIRGLLLPIENSIQGLLGKDLSLPQIDLSHLKVATG